MKIHRMAIPKLAAYSILFPLVPIALMILLTFPFFMVGDMSEWIYFAEEVLFGVLVIAGSVYYYRKAFSRYKITSNGLSNPYITIDWNQVATCEVYSVDVIIFSRFHKNELTRVCVFPTESVYSYRQLDPRRCVFFEINKKNIGLIARYCTHPSEDVKALLRRYSDLLDESIAD